VTEAPNVPPVEDLTVLISAERIQERVEELASAISEKYRDTELVVVGVLRAAVIFLADLVRGLDLPARLDFLSASSYGDGTSPQQPVVLSPGLIPDVTGRDVLLVDTVLDSGRTLRDAVELLRSAGPRSLSVCVLVRKEGAQEVEAPAEFVGFTVPDRFLVGYGLDYAQRYRNLPYIAALPEE
jgi:hypoxanthine phosphoribosyltransferase